jgi:nucleoside-diphosphate-sugar epimerase
VSVIDNFLSSEPDNLLSDARVEAMYHHRAHGLPVVRARFQNVYGPVEF